MHRKRLTIPKSWPVPSKTGTWIYKTQPGPHADGIPLGVIVRDFLQLTKTSRETGAVLRAKKILVDGKPRRAEGYPVGFMDVISVPSTGKHYRVVALSNGLSPIEIDEKEAKKKLVKVIRKTTIKGGKQQTTTHDGRNFLKEYPMGASLLISLPDQKVEKVMELKEGVLVTAIGGGHMGSTGKVLPVSDVQKKKGTFIVEAEGGKIEVPGESVFVVGSTKSEVKIK